MNFSWLKLENLSLEFENRLSTDVILFYTKGKLSIYSEKIVIVYHFTQFILWRIRY